MADERVEIEIILDDGRVAKGFQKVEKRGKKAGRSINTTFKQSFRLLTKEVLAFSGVFIGLFAGREILAAAGRQEKAITQLNTALRNAGSFSIEASVGIQAFATEIQRTTKFGDELILQQTALARNFARSNEEAVALTRSAVDLSEATGTSLDSAIRNLGKTFAGLTGELGESLPAIRTLTVEQLKNGEAIKLVSDLFGGTAARNVQTFTGRLEQLGNNFGDTLEGLGQFITMLPLVSGLIGIISQNFSSAAKSLKSFTDSAEDIAKLNDAVIQFGQNVVIFVIAPIEVGVQALFAVFKTIQAGFAALASGVFTLGEAIVRALAFATGGKVSEEATQFFNFIREQALTTANEVSGAFEDIGTFNAESFSSQLSEGLDSFRLSVEEVRASLDGLNNPIDKLIEKAKEISFQFSITGKQIAGAISGGVQSAVKAAKSGSNFLEGFFGGFLAFIGNWAIQTGTTLIALGLGIEALKSSILTLSGGQAIAAGIALVALGTLLSTLSTGTATGAGGGVASGTDTGGGIELAEAEEAERAVTEVAINVEGTVLDPVAVGNQIAEILNDTFEAGGTSVITRTV